MDPLRIAVRVVVAYLYLLLMVRLSGKRVVVQATPFDFVAALIVGDMFDDAVWAEVGMAKFAVGVGSLFVCDALTKLGASRWRWFHKLVDGVPAVLLRDGVEDGDGLRREQLNEDDLAHLLRLDGIDDWSKVAIAAQERDHELSCILTDAAEPVQKRHRAAVEALTQ
jgi:uncharacterized membrane protein YcaP (DUF421 family)